MRERIIPHRSLLIRSTLHRPIIDCHVTDAPCKYAVKCLVLYEDEEVVDGCINFHWCMKRGRIKSDI